MEQSIAKIKRASSPFSCTDRGHDDQEASYSGLDQGERGGFCQRYEVFGGKEILEEEDAEGLQDPDLMSGVTPRAC